MNQDEGSWDKSDKVDHPSHYGGDTVYEHIKVAEAWGLNYALGNATKYICRAGKKDLFPGVITGQEERIRKGQVEDLRKAAWYLQHEIERLEKNQSRSGEPPLSHLGHHGKGRTEAVPGCPCTMCERLREKG
jgi:hypothetical protein